MVTLERTMEVQLVADGHHAAGGASRAARISRRRRTRIVQRLGIVFSLAPPKSFIEFIRRGQEMRQIELGMFNSAKRMRVAQLLWLILAIGSTSSNAQTIFNDGGTHTIDTPNGPIEVLDGSTLNLNSGAVITGGVVTDPLGYTASVFGDASSTINLNGGQVLAPMAPGSPAGNISGIAIFAEGSFNATAGLAEGGMGARYQDGGFGLLVYGPVAINGGTFQGGTGAAGGDGAIFVNDGGVNNISITGGTFIGGDATGGGGGGIALIISTNGVASISGGEYSGGANSPIFGGVASSLDSSAHRH